MSHNNLLNDATGRTASPANAGVAVLSREGELAPEIKDAIVARAKEIIGGRIQPPALVAPPEVETFLQREFGESEPQPTAEALRRITERLYLEAHYGGRPIACYRTPAGGLAVLASGEYEIEALLRGLSHEEGAKVVVTDSEQV